MRKINSIITPIILLLFVIHMVWGGLILAGMTEGGNPVMRVITCAMAVLVAVHIVIGFKLSMDTAKAQKKSGVTYKRQNRLFWIRRDSGFALVLFMLFHVLLFRVDMSGSSPTLPHFGILALASQILLVLSLVVHLLTNIRPLRVALGIRDEGNLRTDIIMVLATLLFLAGAAFVIYYIRWMIV